jgi:hypothetical protein
MCALEKAPEQALFLLRRALRPVQKFDGEQMEKFVNDLDNDEFAIRQRAHQGLKKLGELAMPMLRKKLNEKGSIDAQARIRELLDVLTGPVKTAVKLQSLRAVVVLEHIGSLEAQAILQNVAKGAPEAWVTQDAQMAISRLTRHKAK